MRQNIYIIPFMKINEAQCSMVVAVSVINGTDADPSNPVLTKENADWSIWDDEEKL